MTSRFWLALVGAQYSAQPFMPGSRLCRSPRSRFLGRVHRRLAGKRAATPPEASIAYLSIPLAALALLLAAAGVALPSMREWALRAQAVFFLLLLIYLLQFAWSVIVNAAPVDGRYAWNPVLFAFVVAYPVYLARRVLFPTAAATQVVARYSHLIALFVSVVISALVLYRAAP